MRYIAVAALCGTLVLAACGEESRPAPMEPVPETTDEIRCIKPGFPVVQALLQISGTKTTPGLYPLNRPRPLAQALGRVSEIAALWTLCKPEQARVKLTAHIRILLDDFRDGRLTGGTSAATAQRVNQHINTMLVGVGLQPIELSLGSGTSTNFGVGFFVPDQDLRVQATGPTGQVEAALLLDGSAFNVPTIITIVLRSDFPSGEGNPTVFPPFYEISASNSNPTPVLAEGLAVVGFCVEDALPGFPSDPVIAHIRFDDVFERLVDADGAQYASLGLDCPRFGSETGDASLLKSGFTQRLREFASAIFLPTEAQATFVGRTGLGGLASSLSPFGVTEREDEGEGELSLERLDPQYSSERQSTSVIRRVQLLEGDNSVQGQPVTFTTGQGSFSEFGPVQDSTVTTDADGQASITWYLPGDPTVAGVTASASDLTTTYTVAIADGEELTALPCDLEGAIRSLNSETPVNVRFTNDLGSDGDQVSVFWLNFNGQREFPVEGGGIGEPYNVLDPTGTDSSYVQPTFRTHPWVLTTPGGETGECRGIFLPLPPTEVPPGEANGGEAVVQPTF